MKAGDLVKRKDGQGAVMTDEKIRGVFIDGSIADCIWFDEEEKQRKLSF